MMSHPVGKSFSEFFETVVLQSEQELITAQIREYYADFFLPKYFVHANIISSKTLQGVGEKFTVISSFPFPYPVLCRSMLFKSNSLLQNIL